MLPGREEYVAPVGFAREPAVQRRHWFGRIALGAFIVLLGYLLLNGVISPPDDGFTPQIDDPTLPGPL